MARRSVEEFLEGFVLPLVAGGEMVVGAPIDQHHIEELIRQLPHASHAVVKVDEARDNVISELVVRPPALVLDTDELYLAASVHNLLFLAHPSADSWTLSSRALQKVAVTAQHFARQPLRRERHCVLARHGLLHKLFDIARTDTTVSWWTGKATYYGQRPPARLSRWSTVRRVRENQRDAGYEELLAGPDTVPIVASLMRRSPITLLLSRRPSSPPVHWEDAVFLLRDPELARAISYNAVAPGSASEMFAIPARLAAAFEQMLERKPAAADVRAIVAFLVHLNTLIALAESQVSSNRSPLLSGELQPDKAGSRPRGLATFLALPSAAALVDPILGEEPGLGDDANLLASWRRQRQQVDNSLGQPVIDALAQRLRRHLNPEQPVITRETEDPSGTKSALP